MRKIALILCFLLAKGKLREAGRYLGFKTWGIIAGLSILWLTGVYLDGGRSYIENLLFHQTFGRAVNSFHHSEPFWYYLVCIWYVTAPYCLATIGALGVSAVAFFRKKKMSDIELLFGTAVIATVFMLSCFSGKLAIYLAPMIPFLVYLFPVVEAYRLEEVDGSGIVHPCRPAGSCRPGSGGRDLFQTCSGCRVARWLQFCFPGIHACGGSHPGCISDCRNIPDCRQRFLGERGFLHCHRNASGSLLRFDDDAADQ